MEKHWIDDKPPKSLLEYKELYPHQNSYDAALDFINWQSKHIEYLYAEETRIREGYKIRIDRLEDKLEQRENELADFKLRLQNALNSLEEMYNSDCIHYTIKDTNILKDHLQEIYNRAGMILSIEQNTQFNKWDESE